MDLCHASSQEITEAYSILIDVTQRHFYDQHGFSCDGLKKKGMPSIFDYKPKWSLYEGQEDSESTAVEDWFKAQGLSSKRSLRLLLSNAFILGHTWDEPKITLRQRMKNAYVEYRWGMKFYNFPWEWPGN